MALRVVLGPAPALLRDLIRTLVAGDPDVDLVAEADDDEVLTSARGPDVDVLVLGGQEAVLQPAVAAVLDETPGLRAVVVSAGGEGLVADGTGPARRFELTPENLLAAVRTGGR